MSHSFPTRRSSDLFVNHARHARAVTDNAIGRRGVDVFFDNLSRLMIRERHRRAANVGFGVTFTAWNLCNYSKIICKPSLKVHT